MCLHPLHVLWGALFGLFGLFLYLLCGPLRLAAERERLLLLFHLHGLLLLSPRLLVVHAGLLDPHLPRVLSDLLVELPPLTGLPVLGMGEGVDLLVVPQVIQLVPFIGPGLLLDILQGRIGWGKQIAIICGESGGLLLRLIGLQGFSVGLLDALLSRIGDVEQADGVCDKLRLNVLVYLRVVVETRGVINLQQVGLEFLVYQDIEAKKLEAGPVAGMGGGAGLVGMSQLRLNTK